MSTRYIRTANSLAEVGQVLQNLGPDDAGIVWRRDTNTLYIWDPDSDAAIAIDGVAGTAVAGVAANYKLARGVHQQVAQSDTIVTGLATVVAVVVSYRDVPTAKQQYVIATIGDQAGTPAAGSVLIKTYKSTLAVADDFTDNMNFNWVAIGT